jgi:hypothetical protein
MIANKFATTPAVAYLLLLRNKRFCCVFWRVRDAESYQIFLVTGYGDSEFASFST